MGGLGQAFPNCGLRRPREAKLRLLSGEEGFSALMSLGCLGFFEVHLGFIGLIQCIGLRARFGCALVLQGHTLRLPQGLGLKGSGVLCLRKLSYLIPSPDRMGSWAMQEFTDKVPCLFEGV